MARRALQDPDKLSETDEAFALAYLRNGYNATGAYRETHPKANNATAGIQGYRTLQKPKVSAFIDRERAARRKRAQMDGDEALEGLTRIARADVRQLFRKGKLRPMDDWPDDVADAVKAVRPTRHGTTVVLHDKLKARELMAIATGRLRQAVDTTHTFRHELYLGAAPPDIDLDE